MSLLGRLFGGTKKVKRIALTELGKQKAESLTGAEGIRLKIMAYLEENGSSSLQELANGIGYNLEKVKIAANQLYREGWVQVVTGSTD